MNTYQIAEKLLQKLPSPKEMFLKTLLKAKEKGMTFDEYVEWEEQEYKKRKEENK